MSTKTLKISGWVLSILLGLLFAFSASMKLMQSEEVVAQAAAIGLGAQQYFFIGIVEILALVLFLIPRTGVLGSLVLVAYMGGAIVTHLLHQQPIAVPLLVEALVWTAAALRFPELVRRLFSRPAVETISFQKSNS